MDPKQFFVQLVQTPSPSGYEEKVQEVVRQYVSPFADKVTTDVHGNVIASRNGEFAALSNRVATLERENARLGDDLARTQRRVDILRKGGDSTPTGRRPSPALIAPHSPAMECPQTREEYILKIFPS